MTLSIPDDLHEMMKNIDVNWSNVAREAFREKAEFIRVAEHITQELELTPEDMHELSQKIKQGVTDDLMADADIGLQHRYRRAVKKFNSKKNNSRVQR